MNLKEILLPQRYNYIGCFLTLDCNLRCGYCINVFNNGSDLPKAKLSGKNWALAINRLSPRKDLPVTLQGGEPSLHPDFTYIINNIRPDLDIDILTNLSFDIDGFIGDVNPGRLRRESPYASIRVSYHPEHMDSGSLIKKVLKMKDAGFSIGVYGILHPVFKDAILKDQKVFLEAGIDFRTKEFLGIYKGKLYGSYLYPDAVAGKARKSCLCRTSELIIGPDGNIFRCHHDLYKGFPGIGSILDAEFKIDDAFRVCGELGDCNPCDIKVKTNRFQVHGHTSVEIKNG